MNADPEINIRERRNQKKRGCYYNECLSDIKSRLLANKLWLLIARLFPAEPTDAVDVIDLGFSWDDGIFPCGHRLSGIISYFVIRSHVSGDYRPI